MNPGEDEYERTDINFIKLEIDINTPLTIRDQITQKQCTDSLVKKNKHTQLDKVYFFGIIQIRMVKRETPCLVRKLKWYKVI